MTTPNADIVLKPEPQAAVAASCGPGRSQSASCARIKDLGFTTSRRIRRYGERFEIVSGPFDEGGCIAVHAIGGNDPTIRTLRLPISVLVGLADLFPKRATVILQSLDGLVGETMNTFPCFRFLAVVALSLIFVGVVFADNAPSKKPLVVNGRTVDGVVVQIDGHSYVDVDALARIMNAAVSFESGRVILTVPPTEGAAIPDRTAPGLSKDFARAGVSQLAEMREWKAAIATAIRSGVAEGNWLGPWLHDHRVRAEGSLSQTSLAASTDSDQKALQLLKNELTNLGSGTAIRKQPSTP